MRREISWALLVGFLLWDQGMLKRRLCLIFQRSGVRDVGAVVGFSGTEWDRMEWTYFEWKEKCDRNWGGMPISYAYEFESWILILGVSVNTTFCKQLLLVSLGILSTFHQAYPETEPPRWSRSLDFTFPTRGLSLLSAR